MENSGSSARKPALCFRACLRTVCKFQLLFYHSFWTVQHYANPLGPKNVNHTVVQQSFNYGNDVESQYVPWFVSAQMFSKMYRPQWLPAAMPLILSQRPRAAMPPAFQLGGREIFKWGCCQLNVCWTELKCLWRFVMWTMLHGKAPPDSAPLQIDLIARHCYCKNQTYTS